jgi:hypothetical protein
MEQKDEEAGEGDEREVFRKMKEPAVYGYHIGQRKTKLQEVNFLHREQEE